MRKVWGIFHNSDPVEGKGLMLLKKLVHDPELAERWVEKQPDYPGHPNWEIKPLNVCHNEGEMDKDESAVRSG